MKVHTAVTEIELAESLPEILERVQTCGERFLIERNGVPVAMLAPVGDVSPVSFRTLAERMEGLELPGEGFADDLEAAQAAQHRGGEFR